MPERMNSWKRSGHWSTPHETGIDRALGEQVQDRVQVGDRGLSYGEVSEHDVSSSPNKSVQSMVLEFPDLQPDDGAVENGCVTCDPDRQAPREELGPLVPTARYRVRCAPLDAGAACRGILVPTGIGVVGPAPTCSVPKD